MTEPSVTSWIQPAECDEHVKFTGKVTIQRFTDKCKENHILIVIDEKYSAKRVILFISSLIELGLKFKLFVYPEILAMCWLHIVTCENLRFLYLNIILNQISLIWGHTGSHVAP